jgi:hypothetical protein
VDKLADAIRRVMDGHREVSSELVFGSLREANPLSDREREILKLAGAGRRDRLGAPPLLWHRPQSHLRDSRQAGSEEPE